MYFSASGQLQKIGQGNCGSVWGTLKLHGPPTAHDKDVVIKREDASPGMDIEREAYFQAQVFCESGSLSLTCVPQFLALIKSDDRTWRQLLPLLPTGLRECRAMIAEKINPVSTKAQLLLVEKYDWAPNRNELMKSLMNGKPEHCLVHLYLGRPRVVLPGQLHPVAPFFSLRDFHLHVDQAQELQLPYHWYARAMAEALAILHWKVGTDGAGIKFVLGAGKGPGGGDAEAPLDRHVIWMLDFDCCTSIQVETDLQIIARAFWRNEPYFPRPNSNCDRDRELWDIFAAEYRRVGIQAVRAGARSGENVDILCNLVDEVLRTIVKTKGRWIAGGYF